MQHGKGQDLSSDLGIQNEKITEQMSTISQQSERISTLESKVEGLTFMFMEHMQQVQGSLKEQESALLHQTQVIERSFREQKELKESYAKIVKGTRDEVIKSVSKIQVAQPPEATMNI